MGSTRGILGLVCALAAGAPAAAHAEIDDGGATLTVADLDWPATTRSVTTRAATKVYAEARPRDKIGRIARGTRLAWRRIVPTRDRCKAWLELEPRGWVCAKDVAPSDEAPGVTPREPAGEERFADVRGAEVEAYATVAEIRAGTPTRMVPGTTFVAIDERKEPKKIGGTRYVKTDQGWIAEKRLRPLAASAFAGIDLVATPPPGWPLAWVVPRKGETPVVRAEPRKQAEIVRELAKRELVTIVETTKGWARTDDGWIDARDLRIAREAAPPDGVGDGERWIDVDLDQQVLVAYEGTTPVYATLVSSGKLRHGTPTGVYRIENKHAKKRMTNPETSKEQWDVAEVPWSMGFRKHYALHGAYWHDGFGKRRSHGCVNLSPRDARWVYGWSGPHVPEGWLSVEDDEAGSLVRIRSARQPDPPRRDFEGKVEPD